MIQTKAAMRRQLRVMTIATLIALAWLLTPIGDRPDPPGQNATDQRPATYREEIEQ